MPRASAALAMALVVGPIRTSSATLRSLPISSATSNGVIMHGRQAKPPRGLETSAAHGFVVVA